MKKVPPATFALRDRQIVSIEVYTPSTSYMKSAVVRKLKINHIEDITILKCSGGGDYFT